MRFQDGLYHDPGIYFGMPEDEYHADCSLGSTDLRNLIVSPAQYYWYSSANQHRKPQKDTKALRYGRAIHKCVLEGYDEFSKFYAKQYGKPLPGQLVTVEDLKQKCKEIGIASSGKKDLLIERILEIAPDTPIYDVEVARYNAKIGDRTVLEDDDFYEIIMAAENIKANEHLKHAFDNGVPEVSVFWEQQGIPCKARFDYLKPKVIVDLKSTRNALQQRWPVAVANFLARGRYEIQATHYMNGRTIMPILYEQGLVDGDYDPDWLERVIMTPDFQFVFVVYQAEGTPLTQGVIFSKEEEDFDVAQDMIDIAFSKYREGFETFGTKEWVEPGLIEYWGSMDWPMWKGT